MRQLLMLALALMFTLASRLSAQDAPAPASPPPATPAPAGAEQSAPADNSPPAPASAAGAAESRAAGADDDFIPTAEVPPDQQVVFPVDI